VTHSLGFSLFKLPLQQSLHLLHILLVH